jgi:hypothetical protein
MLHLQKIFNVSLFCLFLNETPFFDVLEQNTDDDKNIHEKNNFVEKKFIFIFIFFIMYIIFYLNLLKFKHSF